MKFNAILAAIAASSAQAQIVNIRRVDGTSNGLYNPPGQCGGLGGAPVNKVEFPQGGGLGIKFYRDFGCRGEITMSFREQFFTPPINPQSYRIYFERGPTTESFYNAPQYFNYNDYNSDGFAPDFY